MNICDGWQAFWKQARPSMQSQAVLHMAPGPPPVVPPLVVPVLPAVVEPVVMPVVVPAVVDPVVPAVVDPVVPAVVLPVVPAVVLPVLPPLALFSVGSALSEQPTAKAASKTILCMNPPAT